MRYPRKKGEEIKHYIARVVAAQRAKKNYKSMYALAAASKIPEKTINTVEGTRVDNSIRTIETVLNALGLELQAVEREEETPE